MRARSITDVILGEAVSGTEQQRYDDMRNIASVIVNRARALGVPPETVIANTREFNAYNKALPPGASAYRPLAERAFSEILRTGPVNNATFYATPRASGNLPRGLRQETETAGHRYYSDPKDRAIGTAAGYIKPNTEEAFQRFGLMGTEVPTPRDRNAPSQAQASYGIMGMIDPPTPRAVERGVLSDLSPAEPKMAQFDMGRFGPVPSTENFDRGRFGVEGNVPRNDLTRALQEQTAGMQSPMPQSIPTAPVGGLLSSPEDFAREVDEYRASIGKAPVNAPEMGLLSPTPAAPMPGYQDPMVRAPAAQPYQPVAPQMQRAPMQANPMQQAAPQTMGGGLGGLMGGMFGMNRSAGLPGMGVRNMLGGVGGGLLGGALLGPIGALAGGLLGREIGKRTYYPSQPMQAARAPNAPAAPQQQMGSDYNSLNDTGRSVYESSGQFQNAVDSGRGGLW